MSQQELVFAGPHDYEHSALALKLTTVRTDRQFERKPTTGKFKDHDPANLEVFPNHKPLNAIPWIQLATDGWYTPQEALIDLQIYYTSMVISSPAVAITYLLESVYRALSPEHQQILETQTIDEAARHETLRLLFFRSLCQTSVFHQHSAHQYIDVLRDNRMISVPEAVEILRREKDLPRIGAQELQRIILAGKKDRNYQRIVLAGLSAR